MILKSDGKGGYIYSDLKPGDIIQVEGEKYITVTSDMLTPGGYLDNTNLSYSGSTNENYLKKL